MLQPAMANANQCTMVFTHYSVNANCYESLLTRPKGKARRKVDLATSVQVHTCPRLSLASGSAAAPHRHSRARRLPVALRCTLRPIATSTTLTIHTCLTSLQPSKRPNRSPSKRGTHLISAVPRQLPASAICKSNCGLTIATSAHEPNDA